jgi:hypothetical protein
MQEQPENTMSFALYMIGYLVFMAGVVWAAVVVGVPQHYIGLGILVLLGLALSTAVRLSRRRRHPRRL